MKTRENGSHDNQKTRLIGGRGEGERELVKLVRET